ncbi:arsenate reductase family protein [Flagellimonas sediminis]|nr:ArsC/Spx/MgsR family protein [Allomuricauda sediminis]
MENDMGVIATNNRELNLYYNADSSIGMQTLAFVQASKKKVLAVDLSKTKVTGTQWAELANLLGIQIKDLINTEHPDFIKLYGKDNDLEGDDDWIKVLQKNPSVVTQPILVNGSKAMQVNTPSDVMVFLDKES